MGTLISSFWILSANSWMHYPTGHVMRDGIAYPEDWLQIIFSPTFPLRLVHMVIAAYLTTAIRDPWRRRAVPACGQARSLCPHHGAAWASGWRSSSRLAQIVIGDLHGLKTAEYQPAKLAAMEGHWDGSKPGDLVLFAIPNEETETNDYEISIPNGASLIITHELDGLFPGLKDFKVEDRPPVLIPFYGFRLMVGIGFWFIRDVPVGRGPLVERHPVREGRLPDTGLVVLAAGIRRDTCRMVHHRGWAATVDRHRNPENCGRRVAGFGAAGRDIAGPVRGRLRHRVFGRHLLHQSAHPCKGPTRRPCTTPEDHGTPNRPISGAESAGREVLGSGA